MSTCKILFFASLKELAGERQITLEVPNVISVGELRSMLQDKFPSLKPAMDHAFIAVNREYSKDEVIIPPEAEIAIFPPVSGGISFRY